MCVCVCLCISVCVLYVCVRVRCLSHLTLFLFPLLYHHPRTEDCILKSLFILAKGLQHIQSKQMQNMFARFLLGSPSEKNHKLQQALVSYVDHISEEVSYAALHLFDSILRLPNVSVVGALLGLGGEGCTYPQGTGRQPRSWIQERETLEELVSL